MTVTTTTVRDARSWDTEGIIAVAAASGLFDDGDLAAFAPMIREGVGAEALWPVAGEAAGAAFAEPEGFADRVWNLRFIAMLPGGRRAGGGSALLTAVEARLRGLGARLLLIDTGGGDAQAGARAFYAANGYDAEARIRDYYAEGEDRVIFRKRL